MARSRFVVGLLICGVMYAQQASALADGQGGSTAAGKAGSASSSTLPDARVLGITESALKYCTGLDPSAGVKLELQKRKLVRGASQQDLDKIRGSNEYRQAYAAESDFVAKVDEHNAKRICLQALAKRR